MVACSNDNSTDDSDTEDTSSGVNTCDGDESLEVEVTVQIDPSYDCTVSLDACYGFLYIYYDGNGGSDWEELGIFDFVEEPTASITIDFSHNTDALILYFENADDNSFSATVEDGRPDGEVCEPPGDIGIITLEEN